MIDTDEFVVRGPFKQCKFLLLQVTDVKCLSILILIVLFQHLTNRAWIQLRWHKFLVSMISHYPDQGWIELVFPRVFSKFVNQLIEISHKFAWLCSFRALAWGAIISMESSHENIYDLWLLVWGMKMPTINMPPSMLNCNY